MSGASRDIVAVVVATQSPIGRASELIAQCTTHLPVTTQSACAWCLRPWPCPPFIAAARAAQAAGVRAGCFTPTELHGRLPRELSPEAASHPVSALGDLTTPYGGPPVRPQEPDSPS